MRELGISIYVGHSDLEKNKEYMVLAKKYGFKRIFTCLLSIAGDKDKIIKDFKETLDFATSLGFESIVDVSPGIFKELKISYGDLRFFSEIEAYGIRLDEGFSGNEESMMTFNPYNLKIELNMSNNTRYIDTIMDYIPNKHNLLGCHNFYPHKYSGLTREHFRICNNNFMKYGLKTSAFINSQEGTFGPWPVDEGLCTLEEHRELPVEIQAKDLFAEGIDVVIISNCYASEDELRRLGDLNRDLLEFQVEIIGNLPEVETKIIEEELHFNRGDVSENMIRSTQSRVKYKGHKFELINPVDIKRGDVIIESSLYGHYSGELQIAKKDMKNSGKTSVVGKIIEMEHIFLDRIKPWEKFRLKKLN
ncbi:MAG: DUF871 domain-containing protein [Fusobacteriaceae bacterium]